MSAQDNKENVVFPDTMILEFFDKIENSMLISFSSRYGDTNHSPSQKFLVKQNDSLSSQAKQAINN